MLSLGKGHIWMDLVSTWGLLPSPTFPASHAVVSLLHLHLAAPARSFPHPSLPALPSLGINKDPRLAIAAITTAAATKTTNHKQARCLQPSYMLPYPLTSQHPLQ